MGAFKFEFQRLRGNPGASPLTLNFLLATVALPKPITSDTDDVLEAQLQVPSNQWYGIWGMEVRCGGDFWCAHVCAHGAPACHETCGATHNYIGHNYMGQNYMGHNYIRHAMSPCGATHVHAYDAHTLEHTGCRGTSPRQFSRYSLPCCVGRA